MGQLLTAVEATDPHRVVEGLERVWAKGGAALLLDPRLNAVERPVVPPEATLPPGTALVLATSGSTGVPKLVALGTSALEAAAELTNGAVGASPGDRWLCCLPVTSIGGLMTLLRSRALGSAPVLHERFDVERVRTENEARFISLVPTMLTRLLDADVDLTRFERVLLGGAPASDGLIRRARARSVRLTTTYGMTETAGGVVYDGVPLPGVRVKLGSRGRIKISSPTLFSGYLGPYEGPRSGWFSTNDSGVFQDGKLRVLGRLDATIISGGRNIDPTEVVERLREHPGIAEVLVRGAPDPAWGERVVAVVVARDPEDPPTLQDVHRFLEGRLSRYKWPRELRVVETLPKS